ncbi:TonB-dependent receptor [bacterium]|nr:TonB-dependent receptor [bacterium]
MRNLWVFSVALLITSFLVGTPAFAQLGSGTLSGVVRDDQGQGLPGVTVTAKNVDTGWSRLDITADNGAYRIPSVPFGTYDVSAELASFATQVQTGIRVDVGRTVSVNFAMRLSSTAEVIEVTGETPLIEKTESHVATVVTPEQVENLPLNGRQFANLAALAPGTTLGFHPDPTRPSNAAVSLIGGSGRNLNVTIDGGDNNDDTVGGINQFFPLDAVAEFNFLTNRYKAEYGRSSGGVLNVVTKAGTNELHGSFTALFRDDKLNSLSTSEANSDIEDPTPFSREQFGAGFGGPIVKDRAHFFASFSRLQDDVESIVDTAGVAPEFDGPATVPTRDTLFTGKVTSNLNPTQFLTVRYGQQKTTTIYGAAPYNAPNARGTLRNDMHSLLASHSYVISEDKLNEFTFQWADFKNEIRPSSEDASEFFPENGIYLGQNINTPQTTEQEKFQFKDDFSFSWRGNHHFKTGINFVHEPTLGGTFTTGTQNQFVHLFDDRSSPITTITRFGGEFGDETPNKQFGIYFQDDWNVNEKLTMNLGLRYDYVSGFDLDQSENALYPALVALPFDFPWLRAFKEHPDGVLRNDKNNIQPRVGFAYDWNADGITVIRGGFGLYYDFPYTNANILFPTAALGNYGVEYFVEDPNGIRNADGSFFQVGDPLPPNSLPGLAPNLPNEVASPDFVVPYTRQYSVGVSHQLTDNSAIDVDYVRTEVRDQFLRFRANGNINGVDILPDFGNFRVWYNGGFSDYDGLSFSYRGRVAERVQVQASYTLSRAEGNTLPGTDEFRLGSTGALGGCRDCSLNFMLGPKDDPRQVGPVDTDARHRIILSGIFDLPYDIRLSGFFRARSSVPFNVFVVQDLDGDGFAYSLAPGVDAVNSNREDKQTQLDLRVSKIFEIGETVRIEGIFEIFNLFNAENPAVFRGDRNSAAFGTPRVFAGDVGRGEQRLAQIGFRVEF